MSFGEWCIEVEEALTELGYTDAEDAVTELLDWLRENHYQHGDTPEEAAEAIQELP